MSNPFLKREFAKGYDSVLKRKVVRTIRAQEAECLRLLFTKFLTKTDAVLEIGAGTGYYTLDIAERVKSLIALEPSSSMAAVLLRKIEAFRQNSGRGESNIKLVLQDFFSYKPLEKFDHVVAIGVLDYIEQWQRFLDRCIDLSNKSVLFTIPNNVLLGKLYRAWSWLQGVKIYTHTGEEIRRHLKKYSVNIQETGFAFGFLRGLTLVGAVDLAS